MFELPVPFSLLAHFTFGVTGALAGIKRRYDMVFRLAEDHGIVLLNGSGFAAPDWSVRISFANLDDHVYDDIGRAVRAVARGYNQAYQLATGKNGSPAKARNPRPVKR